MPDTTQGSTAQGRGAQGGRARGKGAPPEGDAEVEAFRAALLAWYDANARDLPWRAGPGTDIPPDSSPDPYRVWLAEVMLQQTTVALGTPYWERFVEAFPTVCDLARAPLERVMGMWAGLGYYARARNLHACAVEVCDGLGGVFPTDEAALLRLPGIGPYTAAAVAAICVGSPTNVVDGNVERVVSRLFAVDAPLPKARPSLRRLAARLVRPHRASDYPQALMELGATVCRPRAPLCGACPVAGWCAARAEGEPAAYPKWQRRKAVPLRHGHAFVVCDGDRVWLQRRPATGLLGGTLGFPTNVWGETAPGPGAPWRAAGEVEHVFSHFRLRLGVWVGGGVGDLPDDAGEGAWHDVEEMAALPTLMRKVWEAAR